MSKKENAEEEKWVIISLLVLIVLFSGEPALIDVIIRFIQSKS
tara:strand:+ start:914 stop:1042 length:129 start_codon:yes stop_codon:yes gene_type:complete